MPDARSARLYFPSDLGGITGIVLPLPIDRLSVSESGKHDFLAFDGVDPPILPYAEAPCVGYGRQPADVTLRPVTPRIFFQEFERRGESLLNLPRKRLKLRLRAGREGDRKGGQSSTSEVQILSNLAPGTPLFPP